MWILNKEDNNSLTIIKYALMGGEKSYSIGRAGTDIVISKDSSISRKHASLTSFDDHLELKDLKSTYGTYVGEEAIKTSANGSQADRILETGIKITDKIVRVRFGLHSSIFKLTKTKFIISTSALSRSAKEELFSNVEAFGENVSIISDWTDEVTHLVMNKVILTIKVANALAKGVPIVTPEYWKDFASCASTNQILPDLNNFIPPLAETSINSSKISLKPIKERSSVFKNKTFIFSKELQANKFRDSIQYAGGSVKVTLDYLSFVKNKDCIVIRNGNEDSSLDIGNRQTISEAHIGLAILFASTDMYCNPDYKSNAFQKPSETTNSSAKTLVAETQKKLDSSSSVGSKTRIYGTLSEKKFPEFSDIEPPSDELTELQESVRINEAAQSVSKVIDEEMDLFDFTPKQSSSNKKKSQTVFDEEEDLFCPSPNYTSTQSKGKKRLMDEFFEPSNKKTKLSESESKLSLVGKEEESDSLFDTNSKPSEEESNCSKKRPYTEEDESDNLFDFKVKKKDVFKFNKKRSFNDNESDSLFSSNIQSNKIESSNECLETSMKKVKLTNNERVVDIPKVSKNGSNLESAQKTEETQCSNNHRKSISSDEHSLIKYPEIDRDGFISCKNKTKLSDSAITSDEVTKSFIVLVPSDNLLRKEPMAPRVSSKNVKNFKKFKRKVRNIPSARITDFSKSISSTISSNEIIKDFFINENDSSQNENESEDFWAFQNSTRKR